MPEYGRQLILSAAMAAAFASVAGAQECDIDEGRPSQVSRAFLAVNLALQSEARPQQAAQQLRSAVKLLTENPDRIIRANPVGRNFVLGKALALWLSQENVPVVTQRGPLGYPTDPEGTINLAAAIDTAFKAVEAAMPQCASVTAQWRQQKGWVTLINEAIEAANEERLDEAQVAAEHSLQLFSGAPYGHMVMASIAAKRNEYERAVELYKRSLEVAGSDTTFAEIRPQILLNLAGMAAEAAQEVTGPLKDMLTREARAAYTTLADDPTAGPFRDAGRDGATRLALAAGDTAAVKASYQDMLVNPAAYGWITLMTSAITAAHADQVADATKLLEAAHQRNAYHRDVLYNLALMYIRSGQARKAMPFITDLISVDPANGENYRLFWHAWAGIQQNYYDRQRNARDGTPQKAALQDSTRMATDSALWYSEVAQGLKARVQINEFTPRDNDAVFAGSVLNAGDASQSYNLKVEFLDGRGQVVTTEQRTIGPVEPGSTGRFNIRGTGSGIAAFRYAPL